MKYLLQISFLVLFVNLKVFSDGYTDYAEKHKIIALRDIGHKLLLHAHDSTSRVLPIKSISENIYQIEFQSDFTFVADTLINLVHNNLKATNLPTEYIVSVFNCENMKLIYGYEVSKKTGNVIPCLGRTQPKACYKIQIQFLPKNNTGLSHLFWLAIPFSFVFYLFSKKYFLEKKQISLAAEEAFLHFGNLKFNLETYHLKSNNETIDLTEKETKLFRLFSENVNQVVDRELLMKNIWEDEGIIVVGRSLDVMVSKLRKKLDSEPKIKIVNVHGKGYKMVFGA